MKTTIYKRGMRFRKGDLLAIKFGAHQPSVFQVVRSKKDKNILTVRVLADFYESNPYPFNSIINIGPQIYGKEWFFVKMEALK